MTHLPLAAETGDGFDVVTLARGKARCCCDDGQNGAGTVGSDCRLQPGNRAGAHRISSKSRRGARATSQIETTRTSTACVSVTSASPLRFSSMIRGAKPAVMMALKHVFWSIRLQTMYL